MGELRAEIDAVSLQREFLDAVFRYVVRRVPNRQDAEDITAEVFGAAFQSLSSRRAGCPPLPWLLGIARRRVADTMRRRSRRPETLESDLSVSDYALREIADCSDGGVNDPQARLHLAEQIGWIRRLISALNPDQREALLLRYADNIPISEIALIMGRSPAAVNSLLQRSRASLYQSGKFYFLDTDEVVR